MLILIIFGSIFIITFLSLFLTDISHSKKIGGSKSKTPTSILLPMPHPTMTDEQVMSHRSLHQSPSFSITTSLKSGYVDHHLYPPGIVYINPHSEVYHRIPVCCGRYLDDDGHAMMESLAITAGLRRCSKCDWDTPFDELLSRYGLE